MIHRKEVRPMEVMQAAVALQVAVIEYENEDVSIQPSIALKAMVECSKELDRRVKQFAKERANG